MYDILGSPEIHLFLIFVGIGVLLFFVLGNIFMALTTFIELRFVQSAAYTFTSTLMRGYLYQSYEFFLNRNGAELSKNLFSEVGQVVAGVMTPLMHIASKGTMSLVILIFLLFMDPMVAIVALGVFGGSYGVIFWLVKKRLTRLGAERVKANRERFRIDYEVFGGIKQVKLSGISPFWWTQR